MAKEQLHNWSRYILLAIVIIFAGGGYAMKVNSMSADVLKNENKIEKVEGKVHKLEVNQERDIALKESLLGTMSRIETSATSFREEMRADMKEQRVAQKIMSDKVIETSTKVNTLIKD